jgi:hypothetical protein
MMRRSSSRPSTSLDPITMAPRNQSGLTKNEILARVNIKDKDKISKLSEDEFRNTVLKPNGEVVEYKPGTEIDEMTYDSSNRRMILKDQSPMSNEDYVKTFNENLDALNDIIAKNNKSGVNYKVKELTPEGRLIFSTPAGQKGKNPLINQGSEDVNIPEGESSWIVGINPGQWKGNVEDIANTEYFRSIPGLEMSNTTQGVFSDRIARRGSGAYDSLNEYLKTLGLGRVKPGFNSQTAYSRGAWENFINSGKAFGFYGAPNTVYGTMRTVAPYAIPTIAGTAALRYSQQPKEVPAPDFRHGGWLDKYQVGSEVNCPDGNCRETDQIQAIYDNAQRIPERVADFELGVAENLWFDPSTKKEKKYLVIGKEGDDAREIWKQHGVDNFVAPSCMYTAGLGWRCAPETKDYMSNFNPTSFNSNTGFINAVNKGALPFNRVIESNQSDFDSQKTGNLRPGDIVNFKGPGVSHGMTFTGYDEKGNSKWFHSPGSPSVVDIQTNLWKDLRSPEVKKYVNRFDVDRYVQEIYNDKIQELEKQARENPTYYKKGGVIPTDNQDYNYIKYKDLSLSRGTGWLDNYK